jgi:hypothetical protein
MGVRSAGDKSKYSSLGCERRLLMDRLTEAAILIVTGIALIYYAGPVSMFFEGSLGRQSSSNQRGGFARTYYIVQTYSAGAFLLAAGLAWLVLTTLHWRQ